MSLVNFGILRWPPRQYINAAALALSAVGEQIALLCQAPQDMTITAVSTHVVGVTAAGNIEVRIETLSATAPNPSGSLWAANTNGTAAVSATGALEVNLTSGAVLTRGEKFAVVLSVPAASTLNATIRSSTVFYQANMGFPFFTRFAGAAWAVSSPASIIPKMNTGAYMPLYSLSLHCVGTAVATTFSSSTNPNHRGNKITVPVACRVAGVWAAISAVTGDFALKVWDDSQNLLGTISWDKDHGDFAATNAPEEFLFVTPFNLTAGQTVRVAMVPTTTSSLAMQSISTASAAILSAHIGGSQCVRTTANDPASAGDWTDNTAAQEGIGLLIDQIEIPEGGGSGLARIIGG